MPKNEHIKTKVYDYMLCLLRPQVMEKTNLIMRQWIRSRLKISIVLRTKGKGNGKAW